MLERLTFLVPGFPADESDTSCLPAIQTYVRAFARLHPEVRLQVLAFQYPLFRRAYRWYGIPVFAAGGSNRGGLHKLSTWGRVWRNTDRPDRSVLHSFWVGECALIGDLLSRRHHRPHVATVGGQELRKPSAYARLLSHGRFILTAGSTPAAETAVQTLGRPVDAVVPLGLDQADVCRDQQERDIDVLAVGSVIPLKRFDILVDLAEKDPRLRCIIVGEGPERPRLMRRNVQNVRFLGARTREDVLRLMRRSRILLHPSEYESQGYVFLEALASGMHVVCRDVGAPGSSDHVHRCSDSDEMLRIVQCLAASDLDHRAVPVASVDDTVAAFEEIYLTSLGGMSQRS